MQFWRMVTVLSSGAVMACAGEAAQSGVTVADSAGVSVVTNERTVEQAPLRSLTPEVAREIVDDVLFQVSAIRPLPDGTVAVGVNGASSVVLFDAGGAQRSTLGRQGEGPGEFRNIQSLVPLPGDSLGVYDSRLLRLTVFPLDGGIPRVVGAPEGFATRGGSRVWPLGHDLVLAWEAGFGSAGAETGLVRSEDPSYRLDLSGEVLARYGPFPGVTLAVGEGLMGMAPFGARLSTTTVGDQFIVGTGDAPEFRLYGPDGGLTRVVRWADVDRTVTQERMDSFVDFMVSKLPPEQAEAARPRFASLPFAPVMAAYQDILAAPGGGVWVGEYPGPEAQAPFGRRLAPRRWAVFGPDGTLEERVETPVGFMPMVVAEGLVWGVYVDELDVESVRAYDIAP